MHYCVSALADNEPANVDTHRAALLGFVCRLSTQSAAHANLPLQRVVGHFNAPLEVAQYKLYFNNFGQCVGFVTWAYLAPDVEKRLLRGEDYRLHTCEWNEGGRLWIMDMLVPHGSIRYVLEDLRDNVFKNFDVLTYFRIKNGKRLFKQVSRADGGHFFRQRKRLEASQAAVLTEAMV